MTSGNKSDAQRRAEVRATEDAADQQRHNARALKDEGVVRDAADQHEQHLREEDHNYGMREFSTDLKTGRRGRAAVNSREGDSLNPDGEKKKDKRFNELIHLIEMVEHNLERLYQEQARLFAEHREIVEEGERLQEELSEVEQNIEELEAQMPQDAQGNILWSEAAAGVLDDDVLERRANESEEEYQSRIQDELKAEMLNDDGTIKAEYKDNVTAQLLAAREQAAEVKERIEENNRQRIEIEAQIAENARLIEAQLRQKSLELNKLQDGNDKLTARLQLLRKQTPEEGSAVLVAILEQRPDLDVEFEPDDTYEERLEKVERAVTVQSEDIQAELVDVEDEIVTHDERLKSRDISLNAIIADTDDASEFNEDPMEEIDGDFDGNELSLGFNIAAADSDGQVPSAPDASVDIDPSSKFQATLSLSGP